jgi:hypothetical protein
MFLDRYKHQLTSSSTATTGADSSTQQLVLHILQLVDPLIQLVREAE